jgi:hypothetical protein
MLSSVESENSKVGWLQKFWLGFVGEQTLDSASASAKQLQQSLHATTVKLVQVHHQIDRLQSQHNLEMRHLARAYQDLSLQQRQQLPGDLRKSLDRIESDYF